MASPVVMCFTAEGWCYMVEMRDYPLGVGDGGESGGCVGRLGDLDGLGRADESIFFASELNWLMSITPWGRGVLVAAPPDVTLKRKLSTRRRDLIGTPAPTACLVKAEGIVSH
jgi:hypothetical protein